MCNISVATFGFRGLPTTSGNGNLRAVSVYRFFQNNERMLTILLRVRFFKVGALKLSLSGSRGYVTHLKSARCEAKPSFSYSDALIQVNSKLKLKNWLLKVRQFPEVSGLCVIAM